MPDEVHGRAGRPQGGGLPARDTPAGFQKSARARARVRRMENAHPRFGFSVLRMPLWPDGQVTVVRLDLGIVRYQWGEVK